MPDSNKKEWQKPATTEFSSLDVMRAYYEPRATPEDMERLDRLIDRAREKQERAAEQNGRPLRRRA